MRVLFQKFLSDDSGATAIEYGLIASLIALAIISGASALGGQINDTFDKIKGKLADNSPSAGAAPPVPE